MDFFGFFAGFAGSAGYLVVVLTLVLCGLGVPVPEDIVLISGGFIAEAAGHTVWPMVLTGLIGIMAGDSVCYMMGRQLGLRVTKIRFFSRYLTAERLARVDQMFQRHGTKILIAARFMPGVRSVAFFSAGAMRVPFWKFFLFDGLAALVSAPLWVILGYRYGRVVVDWAKQFQWVLIGAFVVAIVAFAIYRLAARPAPAKKPLAASARPEIAD